MLEDILRSGFAQMGIPAEDKAIRDFRVYFDELEEKNKVMNLTAISGEDACGRLHFLDCAAPLLLGSLNGKSVIDVGTGAGFPGLPLRILCPQMKLTLLDSLNKRIDFLQSLCLRLGYDDVSCIHARAEECGSRREKYDLAVSRAVARLNVLCELCLPYVRPGGTFMALKGPALKDELPEAAAAIELLGGKLERVFDYSIPGEEASHCIAVIQKLSPTPKKYPRRFAMIKKSPL